MNNYSFLESAQQQQAQQQQQQQHNQQRPPPSPSHSQAGSIAASQNGGGQNGVPMVNGLPSGGQQTDMNHLWAVVQQLSQLLEENKAQTRGIVEGVAAIQGRAALEEGGEVGGASMRGGGGPAMSQVNGEIHGMVSCSGHRMSGITWAGKLTNLRSGDTSTSPITTLRRPIHNRFPHIYQFIPLRPPNRLRIRPHSSPR